MIRVQREDFDIGIELERLAAGNTRIGGVASFIGLVRNLGGDDRVERLFDPRAVFVGDGQRRQQFDRMIAVSGDLCEQLVVVE